MKSVKTPARLAAVGGFAAISAAFLPGTSLAATQPGTAHPGAAHLEADRGDAGAVFVQNDNTSGNAIAVYDRNSDGTLSAAGTYPTGGTGGALSGSVVDHLGSQGSLTYDRDSGLLYAVNAGSNTVTVFSVAGDRLIRRQVISSGGTFPVSVTVHGNLVYVLNARDGGSVQGYLRAGAILVKIPAWHRDLGLNPSLTPEFTHTPGDVAFTPDGSKLIVTTKGNGSDIDVFTVAPSGGLSAKPVATSDPAGPFAVSFDAGGHLLVAESGQNNTVATFTIKRDGALTFDSREATGGPLPAGSPRTAARSTPPTRAPARSPPSGTTATAPCGRWAPPPPTPGPWRGRDDVARRAVPVRPDRRRRHRRRVPGQRQRLAHRDRQGHGAGRRRRRGHRRLMT
jgi:6-phosphogluconolactonase (cycloisomerase 2 family)